MLTNRFDPAAVLTIVDAAVERAIETGAADFTGALWAADDVVVQGAVCALDCSIKAAAITTSYGQFTVTASSDSEKGKLVK